MADRDGVVVDVEDDYDYDYDDPSRTVGELVRRSRLCFRDSDFAKIESVLTARENKLKEEIAACDGVNQRLNNELKNLERDKRKAESEAEKWKTHYQLLESRILSLEADAELLKTWKASFRVPGENGGNGVNVELENKVFDVDAADSEEYVNSAAAASARSVGLARQGSGRTPTKNIVEIIDSDDEFAPGGSLSEKKSTIQSFANTAHPDHASLQNATEMLNIKCDSNPSVSENDKNDGAVIGDTSSGDCHRNKLQKVIHVHSNPSVSENDKSDGAVIGDTSSGDCHRNKLQKVIHLHSNPSVSENDKNDGAVIGDTSSGDCHRNKVQKVIHVHSNPSVSENDKSDGAVIGDTSSGDCHRNKFQKVSHVNDGSPDNHTPATDNNFETYVTPSSHFPVTLRQCEEKLGAEHVTRNLLSEIFSGGSDNEDSSSSSSDSDDELMPNLELSQLIKQQDDKKWEYGLEVIASLVTDDKLCLKAVCALYRKQISMGTSPRNLSSSSSGRFDCLDALRVSTLAKFLIDADPQGRLKKSVTELLKFDRNGLDDCKRIAINHSKELLEIYKKKEDPEFHP